MQCACNSKTLYSRQLHSQFTVDATPLPQTRKFTPAPPTALAPLLESLYENSQIYTSSHVDTIDMEQIYASPLWFYKNYVSANRPCVINQAIEGDIIDTWGNSRDFRDLAGGMEASVSITPDGCADSIKGQYFVEPWEGRMHLRDVIDWGEAEKQKGAIKQEHVPYVQHQNSNLSKEMHQLESSIDDSAKNFISLHFFEGNQPDASNFWMGYHDSVSALHKDPYQNFYTTIAGRKHFTLLPPLSIAHLHQDTYQTARWSYDEEGNFHINTGNKAQHQVTRWITANPDLQSDYTLFPEMEKVRENKLHVVLEAGQMLYLPSLWYHQVAQTHEKSPYTMAINYWFDMSFGQGYNLYETARKLKGYP